MWRTSKTHANALARASTWSRLRFSAGTGEGLPTFLLGQGTLFAALKIVKNTNLNLVAAMVAGSVGLFGFSACGQNDMDTMSNHGGTFDSQAARYQADVDSHAAVVKNTSQLSGLAVHEKAHQNMRRLNMDIMQHEFTDMMGCTGPGGERPTSPQVLDDLDRLNKESDLHATAMGGAVDIALAQDEEIRHHKQMIEMLNDARKHTKTMMDGRQGYICGHHSHSR